MRTVTVIIPALNEVGPLPDLVRRIREVLDAYRPEPGYEVLVVDDGSTDGTAEAAEAAGARVIRHPVTLGNGAAVKTGMRAATGDEWVLMDADGQHDPEDLPRLLDGLDQWNMVVGARKKGTGTGLHRSLANGFYNLFAGYVTGKKVEDLTSGFRAMRAAVARRFIYLLPNTFSYPTTLTLAFFRTGHSVKYEPIRAAPRVGKSKIRLIRDGSRFLFIILRIATFFSPFKVFFPMSLLSAALGIGWYVYTFITVQRFTNMSMMLIVQAVILFALALISEQVAQLRFDRSEDHQ